MFIYVCLFTCLSLSVISLYVFICLIVYLCLSFHLSKCIYLSVCSSVNLFPFFVCLFICLSLSVLSVCLFICLSISVLCLFIYHFPFSLCLPVICLNVYLCLSVVNLFSFSLCLSVHLSISFCSLSVCLFICLSLSILSTSLSGNFPNLFSHFKIQFRCQLIFSLSAFGVLFNTTQKPFYLIFFTSHCTKVAFATFFAKNLSFSISFFVWREKILSQPNQGILIRGKYHCTVDLLLDRFGLVCFANRNKNCHQSYSWFQTSQTGGQQYCDTSPFSILWPNP